MNMFRKIAYSTYAMCSVLKTCLCIYIYIYVRKYTWNSNDPCFDWKKPCGLEGSRQNIGGHSQVPGIYDYAWYWKRPLKNSCFSWMTPNHYHGQMVVIPWKNGVFHHFHPFQTCCLGFQGFISQLVYLPIRP